MTDSSTPQSETGDHTLHYATWIVLRVGLPMAGAMWTLAEFADDRVVTEMELAALGVACVLIFVAFNQAIKIADDHLNDLPEDVVS